MKLFILALLLLALPAAADLLNEQIEDAGSDVTDELKPNRAYYHSATGTVSLDTAVDTRKCKGGLDIWFNPDFDGTNVTATYTLYNCPRATASANYASECITADFDPDGGGVNTNVMQYSATANALQLYNLHVQFFGATITDADSDTPQAIIRCK